MKHFLLPSIFISIFMISTTVRADCRHPDGNIQTDAHHAPCADVVNNPLNTMCCAINRSNPSEGYAKDGMTTDVCLPNGLCKQVSRKDDVTPLEPIYYREECTVASWKSGKCLAVCLSSSVSRNVLMTPCDGTANSTRWCCGGKNTNCCSGDIGGELLAQTFLGMPAGPTPFATTSTSNSTTKPPILDTTVSADRDISPVLSGGAIAGTVIGALMGVALVGTATFFIGRRHRSPGSSPPVYIEGGSTAVFSKARFAHEADGRDTQVCEVSAANAEDHDGRQRVHEM